MCNWALFVLWNCCFCFSCSSFVPSCFPAGALLCASVEHLPHRLFPHPLPLSHHFPSLSCPFLSFALQQPSHLPPPNLFYCSFFLSSLFCCISLGSSLLPGGSVCFRWLAKGRTPSGAGQYLFLQLVFEPWRDIWGIEAVVCLSLYAWATASSLGPCWNQGKMGKI